MLSHSGHRFPECLKLYSSREFNHAAGIRFLCLAKGRALDIGARIRIAVGNRLQLKNVEQVESIHLETHHRVMIEAIDCDLFGEAHVGIEEARSSETVAANAGNVNRVAL